jgi:hypothetical protein
VIGVVAVRLDTETGRDPSDDLASPDGLCIGSVVHHTRPSPVERGDHRRDRVVTVAPIGPRFVAGPERQPAGSYSLDHTQTTGTVKTAQSHQPGGHAVPCRRLQDDPLCLDEHARGLVASLRRASPPPSLDPPVIWLLGFLGLVGLVVIYDLVQTKHAILRNFPLIGHFRYWLEAVGPELRQYIVTSNDEERPFSRDQRRWVYASAKKQNNYSGFGTDNEVELASNYLIIKHDTLAPSNPPQYADGYPLPCAKVLGAARGRRKAFRPASVVNISGMSFGSLSAPAPLSASTEPAICCPSSASNASSCAMGPAFSGAAP